MLKHIEIFKSFDIIHILIIILTIALISLTIIFRNKLKLEKLQKILLLIGIITEVIKVFSYIIINEDTLGGYLPKTDLPFHLCSMQIILLLILNFTKNDKLKHLIYGFMLPTCLIGGFAAILLPTSSAKSFVLIFIQYFTYHISIVCFAAYLLTTKEIKFELKDYFNTLLCLVGVLLIAIYINSILNDYISNINFMYVVNPPVDGLPLLNKDHGWFVYILTYAAICVFAVTLCFIKPIILTIINRKKPLEE